MTYPRKDYYYQILQREKVEVVKQEKDRRRVLNKEGN